MRCARCTLPAVAMLELVLTGGRHLPAFPACDDHVDTERQTWQQGGVRVLDLPVQLDLPGISSDGHLAASDDEKRRTLVLYRLNRNASYLPMDSLEMVERVLCRLVADYVLDGNLTTAAEFARMAEYARTVLMPVAERWRDRDAVAEQVLFERACRLQDAAIRKVSLVMDLRGANGYPPAVQAVPGVLPNHMLVTGV